jgi:hypothetical protein
MAHVPYYKCKERHAVAASNWHGKDKITNKHMDDMHFVFSKR